MSVMVQLPALVSSIDPRAVRVRPTLGSQEHPRRDRMVEAHHGAHAVNEDLALMPGLLSRTLASMRSRENMRTVAEGTGAMDHDEVEHWLDMATHRRFLSESPRDWI